MSGPRRGLRVGLWLGAVASTLLASAPWVAPSLPWPDVSSSLGGELGLVALASAGWAIVTLAAMGLAVAVGRTAFPRRLLIASAPAGQVSLDQRTLLRFIEYVSSRQSGVRGARARVSWGAGGAMARVTLTADPDVVVPDLGLSVAETLTAQCKAQLGIELASVEARVRLVAPDARRAAPK